MRSHLARITLAAAAFGGSGCGDTDRPSNELTVVGTEMAFDAPARVAAGDYQVVFSNQGTVHHELAFRSPGGQIVSRRSIAAGQEVELKVTLQPGTWELGCFEPGHYEGGMHRPLVVDP